MSKKKIYLALGIVLAASVAVEALFAQPHHHNLWNVVPGFDLLLGFGGGWLLILAAKKGIGPLIQRREDYYNGGGQDD